MNVINQDIQHENVIIKSYIRNVIEKDIQRELVEVAEKELRKEQNE